MSEFIDFIPWLTMSFVGFLFDLPFLSGISLGDMLVAIGIMGILIGSLVASIHSTSLTPEANKFNAQDRAAERAAERAQWRSSRRNGG